MIDTSFIKGIIPPIITPVDDDSNINEAKMRDQVDFVINGGVHGILAFGSNSEFYIFEEDEYRKILEIIISQTKGRVPVYMGIGAIRTQKCVRLAKMAQELGADGISVLQPMFLKLTDEEMYEHFSAIANAVPTMPMLLYNNPGRTGYTMSYNFVMRMIENCPKTIRMTRNLDRPFKVFGGKDTLVFGTLVHGGAGAVCTTANIFPELVCSIYEKFIAGDLQGALDAQYRMNPVRLSMDLASFPAAAKDMANMAGRNVGNPCRPVLPSSGKVLETMRDEMKKAGII